MRTGPSDLLDGRSSADPSVLLVHHFSLPRISGLTVTVAELARLIPQVDPGVTASCLSFESSADAAGLVATLDRDHEGASCVVGFNLHIEVGWGHTLALASWCRQRGIVLFVYVHDYWPHHREAVEVLTGRIGAALLAITPAIISDLAADGFAARLLCLPATFVATSLSQVAALLRGGAPWAGAVISGPGPG